MALARSSKPWTLLASLVFAGACAADAEPTPFDGDFPIGGAEVTDGAPDNASLPDDNKADAVYPKKLSLVAQQSPVKSQGSRGVCSIFASTAQLENLYLKAGAPRADFSEQYLQWSVKSQLGEFTTTEGSNGAANLKAIVQYGIPEEAAWPYQTTRWNTANDPACTGEAQPTRCYTNGAPPEAAVDAPKFKVPSSRYINTNSIKAHLTTKGAGVVVGMTFFYQAWNHRASTLPVDSALWREGFVTYPNAVDKQKSLEKRAGHAILIVGYDDDLTAPVRDETGAYLKNPDGTPMVEKGFWLFKNSWGTGSFGVANPEGDGYGWLSMKYVAEYGSAVVGETPTLATPDEVCDDDGAADEDRDGQANCDDSDCGSHPACAEDPTALTYDKDVDAAIPDDDDDGIASTIGATTAGAVGTVEVTVDISHTWRGDLTVKLTHAGTTRTLISGEGGSADDLQRTFTVEGFAGKPLAGDWTLTVSDGASQDTGTFNRWSLSLTGA
jgi:hypothetical protein